MLDGTPVSGSYNRYALGASIEAGRHFKLANDVFIEPQLQLSYFWLKGKNFTMDNGLAVDTKNADVVTGRAGLVLGKKWEISKNRYVQPYVKGGVIHEFTGDDKTIINADNVFRRRYFRYPSILRSGHRLEIQTIRHVSMANSNVRMATMSGLSGMSMSV